MKRLSSALAGSRPAISAAASIVGRAVMLASVVAFLILTWFFVLRPMATWFDGRSDAAGAEAALADVEATNTDLEQRLDALQTDREIERIARSAYGLVYPDEEAYAVLPPPERDLEWYHSWPY